MKYYKITNKEEIHNGMEYKTGLNEDILIFNPSGNCASGGIYFSREDILAFLNYGPWIREVSLPEGEEVYENPGSPKKWKSHRVILGERRKIDLKVIKELVEEGADVHTFDDDALIRTSYSGYLEVVKYLIEQGANIHYDDDYALRWASTNGHLDVVKFLVEQGADVYADNDWALRWASTNGHLDVVKFLVEQGADVHADNDWALRYASENGHLEVVKFLVEEGANIHADNDRALRYASENGYLDVVKYLVEQGANIHWNWNFFCKTVQMMIGF